MQRTAASRISRGTVRALLLVPSLHPVRHDHEKDWDGTYSAPGGRGGGYSPIKVTEVLVVPLKVLKAKMTTVRVDTLYSDNDL